MNYKEMLDKFEYLEKKLSYLENENKHLKERVARMEFQMLNKNTPPGPGFTPGTLPEVWPQTNPIWCSTTKTDPRYQSESLR